MTKARQILKQVENLKNLNSCRILGFTGARQVGKTTLVRNALNDYAYLSIEDPVLRPSYAALTASQWNSLYPKAALDEVQKEPSLIESIKSTYDQFENVRYALLGSSQLLLLKQVKESLAGRCSIMELYPLTLPELETENWSDEIKPSLWQELLRAPNAVQEYLPSFLLDPRMALKQKAFDHYVKFGGYPALVSEMSDEERYRWLADYVRTYLERDIRDLASFRDLEPFAKLQQSLALQTGSLFNASSLATRLGLSPKTVQRYLTYLGLSFQTITLEAWERNPGKRLAKAPKVHYLDNGVLQAVLQKRGGLTGGEFESLIVAEIYKQAKNVFAPVKFYHLRSQVGKEIDLLVELQDCYFAFEIKMTEHVIEDDARHLRKLSEILDKPLRQGFVISNDRTTKKIAENITAINAAMFLG